MSELKGKKGGIMIRRLSTSLATIVALVSIANVASHAQALPLLTHHVREVTLNGQARLVGRLPARRSMRIDVVLALRDPAGLESFLRQVYDPSNPSYRRFLTVQEFAEMFGPSQQDYDAVIRFAKANAFRVVGGSRDALDVQLQGSVATIETAFHVNMSVYQHPTENRTFYAPDREPTVDLPFQLWHISGLDNYAIPRPALVRRIPNANSNATTGSCPEQSFCGSDMRAAYYAGTALTGSGQNIGLLEFAGFDIADLNTYYTNAGQTRNFAVTGISTDGTSINCVAPSCDDTEQTLDITQAGGMAPGVTTVYEYVGSTDTALLGCMSSDTPPCPPLPLNLSSSWYWPPPDPTTDDPFFEKMAAQGQSFFEAAGDGGAWRSTNTWWPMESPYVICVGGTDLTTQSAGGPWASETAWVDGGGGISPDKFAIPFWQTTTASSYCSECSNSYRNGPDVSANSNFTFYVCADQTTCTANEYGGTSFAAPMWAGYLALANQQAMADGIPALGFINPAVYNIGLSSSYDTDFHDITSGSNGYSAEVGYDLATGWGSPNGSSLINGLLSTINLPGFGLTASPATFSVAQGTSETLTSTITSTVTNGFDSAISLSATGQPAGVTVTFSPTSITGAGNSTMTITVASSTAAGTYNIKVEGTSGGTTEIVTVSLAVTVAPPNYTISASPTTISVARGSFGKSVITTTVSGGFDSAISLLATGYPIGVTVSFSPKTIPAPGKGMSAMKVTVGKGVALGNHTITINATGGGLPRSTQVTLDVVE
ncbi:MAG TPA: protease pro-enzyme activation domain-containing protein [Terriglobia bacterium]